MNQFESKALIMRNCRYVLLSRSKSQSGSSISSLSILFRFVRIIVINFLRLSVLILDQQAFNITTKNHFGGILGNYFNNILDIHSYIKFFFPSMCIFVEMVGKISWVYFGERFVTWKQSQPPSFLKS